MKTKEITVEIRQPKSRVEKTGAPTKVVFDFCGERRQRGASEPMPEAWERDTELLSTRERRMQIAENVLNVLLGIASVGLAFWAGWLVGSGAICF